MDNNLSRIQNAVAHAPSISGIKIVGIDGPSGSGKSTLAGKLAFLLKAPVIQIDDFVSWNDFSGWWPRLEAQVLDPLLRRQPAVYQQRDWESDEFGVFLNGTVGAGKTTVAGCIGRILRQKAVAHAIIDLDSIRQAWPAPPSDRFNHELEMVNLASLVENYADAGVEAFVLAGVIEDATEIPRYRKALGGRPLKVCRITADESVLRTRLNARHQNDPDGLLWHLNRAIELENILVKQSLDDFMVDSSDKSADVVAREVLELAARQERSGFSHLPHLPA
ncbi:AAA family ATPase [Pseudarthrobacter sp. SSS035]|uniref:AAA family ATPase n=1 Tax=Pseudarthrobacter sp. SSS035 TaxID=2931399 RepID=UPI00200BBC23|nr:hypothetical protein [Pseudarthrobacter sp. SSS035]